MGIKIKFTYKNIYNMKNTKKLKILLLTDRLSLGGAETHILSLYRALSDLGHYVVVASSGGALASDVRHVRINLSSHSIFSIIRGYFALRSLVSKEKFDLIHAHARLPALISHFVARAKGIPLVTTAHARFKTDPFRRRLSVWGFRTASVSEDLRVYLTDKYSIPAENITVIENGIDFSEYKSCASERCGVRLLFLSRLDRDCSLCAELLCSIAQRLYARYENIQITIGGGGECLSDIINRASAINALIGCEVIRIEGEVYDVPEFLSRGDVFVGVSRCALEAVASSIPTVIAGNEGFLGRLTMNNFSYAHNTNFCARGERIPSEESLFSSLCEVIDDIANARKEALELCERAKETLDISRIALRYENFYLQTMRDFERLRVGCGENLLVGYYGFSNLGDDALLRASIDRVFFELGGSVCALTHSPKKTARRFAIPCYSRLSPFSIFWRILKSKRVIFGGGTLFQDRTSMRSLIYYIFILRLAQLLGRDTLVYANGIGDIKNDFLRSWFLKSLSRCSYIGVRDKISFELLSGALSPSLPLVLEKDLALSLSPSPCVRAEYLIHSALGERAKSFFAVCPHASASRFDKFELDIAIRTQKNKGLTPLFILCSPADFYISYSLKRKYGGAIISRVTFSDLLVIFSFARCVISMRYHPLLAARVCSVPMLPIGDDPKLEEFFE